MPRFDFNPADASSGFPVFPKGQYKVEFKEPKSFYNKAKEEGKQDNYGVAFPAKCVEVIDGDPTMVGKPMYIRCFQHTQPSKDFAKQIQMAVLGFTPGNAEQEQAWNDKYASEDWSFNTDDGSCGNGWHLMKGQVAIRSVDVKIQDGQQQQTDKGWFPNSAA